jgi:ATP-dependent 26S proteasome regulatory subunit
MSYDPSSLTLLPAQQQALETIERVIQSDHVAVLNGRPGSGKTTILRALHARLGGTLLGAREIIEASAEREPLGLEETSYKLLAAALDASPAVIVDDFYHVAAVSCCSAPYPRHNFIAAALTPIVEKAQRDERTLIVAAEGMPIPGLFGRVQMIPIPQFTTEDYAELCACYLGNERASALDIKKIHRFAPRLSARQLAQSCIALREAAALDTDTLITYLREHHMASNVDLEEVQNVDLRDLKGLDDVIEALEANVILPLENTEVAEELNLKPKRGVLLAGPPGTGKTTIGRALARRLRSKFFLLDGTVVSGTPHFHPMVHRIFEAAKQNAPAIIFVDDSDVMFENGQETGFYRFLLTMLDGLESTSAGRICLMMTAMDVGNLPPALVRSGRIELWLETRLPDAAARAAILADLCAALPTALGSVDVPALAEAADGLSGADLKRVIEDGKLLFAFERERSARSQPSTTYFLRAIATVRRNKEQYAAAEARARTRRPRRPAYFDNFGGMITQIVESGDLEGFSEFSMVMGPGTAPDDV